MLQKISSGRAVFLLFMYVKRREGLQMGLAKGKMSPFPLPAGPTRDKKGRKRRGKDMDNVEFFELAIPKIIPLPQRLNTSDYY